MTTIRTSLEPNQPQGGPTLADVLARIPDFADVTPQARQNMASAIRTLCRVVDREPSFVPIAAPALRMLFDRASPGALGLSPGRWRNVKSDVRRAVKLSEFVSDTSNVQVPLTEAWEAVAVRAPDATRRSVLRRFGRYCSARQITPPEADDALVIDYNAYLDANQLSRTPQRSITDLIRAWNRHVADDSAVSCRLLTMPNRSRAYTLGWHDLPAALHADVEAYHAANQHPDPLDADAGPAVRPATIRQRDRLLRRIATAEIRGGVDPDALQSLADLTKPDLLKPGLRFFLDRNGGEPNKQLADVIGLVLGIARHSVQAPAEDIDQLRIWQSRFQCKQYGLTEKNRERLRQFTDETVLRALVTLPDRIVRRVRRRPLDSRSARQVQTALALSLLLAAPIRIGNLVSLDRNKHFKWARFDGARTLHLVIPAAEVKNSVDLEFPVPKHTAVLLDVYMTTYQPLLANGHPSALLFPGWTGAPKHDTALRQQITKTVRDELGLTVNPHLFRHLAALLFLEKHPGHYEEVRRLLGHKDINTTIQSYAGLETIGAARRYDDIILELRDEAPDA